MSILPFRKVSICTNFPVCDNAATHRLLRFARNCELCGGPLQPAKTELLVVPGLLWLIVLAGLMLLLKQQMFPTLLNNVRFSTTVTKVAEAAGVVEINLELSVPAATDLTVTYNTEDGTALAGKDYEKTSGVIYFPKGKKEQKVVVSLLPDRNAREPHESFYIVLNNVEGLPRHTVMIEEEGVNKDLLEKSEVVVASLSTLAADIANDMATIRMLHDYLTSTKEPAAELVQRYNNINNSILSARDRYVILFNDASQLDPEVVRLSIENRVAALERQGYEHQLTATLLMQQQLEEYLELKIPSVDRWMKELGELVKIPTPDKTQIKIL